MLRAVSRESVWGSRSDRAAPVAKSAAPGGSPSASLHASLLQHPCDMALMPYSPLKVDAGRLQFR